jgi:hypothetical protein
MEMLRSQDVAAWDDIFVFVVQWQILGLGVCRAYPIPRLAHSFHIDRTWHVIDPRVHPRVWASHHGARRSATRTKSDPHSSGRVDSDMTVK